MIKTLGCYLGYRMHFWLRTGALGVTLFPKRRQFRTANGRFRYLVPKRRSES
jgi:hypothetical protein